MSPGIRPPRRRHTATRAYTANGCAFSRRGSEWPPQMQRELLACKTLRDHRLCVENGASISAAAFLSDSPPTTDSPTPAPAALPMLCAAIAGLGGVAGCVGRNFCCRRSPGAQFERLATIFAPAVSRGEGKLKVPCCGLGNRTLEGRPFIRICWLASSQDGKALFD